MRSTSLEAIARMVVLAIAVVLSTPSPSLADDVTVYLRAQSFDKALPGGATVPMWGFASCTDATFTTCELPTETDAPGPQITVATTSGAGGQAFVDNGISTIDVATNLEWLDLTATSGLSYNQAVASTYVTVDGYRHATQAEVETLLGNAGFPLPLPAAQDHANDASGELLLSLLGCTGPCGTYGTGRGFAEAVTPGTLTRPNYSTTGNGASAVSYSLVTSNFDLVDPSGGGHFLVRDVVVPVTAGVTIHLQNALSDPVSIVIPGQQGGGDPVLVADGLGRNRVQSMTHETLPGQTGVYSWANLRPGTYLYQSGTHPSIQVPMGLYGSLRVGPVTGVSCTAPQVAAYYDSASCYDADGVLLFSEIDPLQNERVADAATALLPLTQNCVSLADWAENSTTGYPCTVDYTPTYFLVNGGTAVNLPAGNNTGSRLLLRLLNAGLRSHTPSIVGLDLGLLAEDGNRYPGVVRRQSSTLLPAGKTLDVLVDMPAEDVTFALYDRMPAFVTGTEAADQTQVTLTVGAGSPPPPPPSALAVDDVYAVTEDTSLNIAAPGVLANDDLSLSGAVVVEGPYNGTLLIGTNGAFAYTPNADFSGSDTFTYNATDGIDSYAAAVTLNVSFDNDSPVATADGPYVNTIGPAIHVAAPGVLGNDADPDGDDLLAVIEGTAPAGLTLNADGSFDYTGGVAETFSYRASDGVEQSDPVTVTLNVNPVGNVTLNVQDPLGASVGDYRWLLQEETSYLNDPSSPAPILEQQSLNFHKSYMPVVAQGCVGTACDAQNPDVPVATFDQAALDPSKQYYVSVLPNDGGEEDGHTIGGAQLPAGASTVDVVVNNLPIVTAQISILVFEDDSPTNGVPEPNEVGLGGFQISLEDAGGRYGISGGTMSQDAYGAPLKNALPCAPPSTAGVIVTCADGTALVENLPPGKYGVFVVAPPDTGSWTQTSTIEGTKIIDAWVNSGEPPYFVEAGAPGYHAFFGFVNPEHTTPPPGGTNSISGSITLLHDPRPPGIPSTVDSNSYAGFSHTRAWVGLNSTAGDGPNITTVQADENGAFQMDGIPDGTYQLVIWDTYLDQVIAFQVVNLPGDAGDLGNIPVNAWFARLEHNVYLDENENAVRDEGEPGLPEQAVNLRWRDGTVFQSFPTDTEGFVPFDQVFPFFAWQVAEVDYTRFKPTGVTVTVDAGGDVTTGPYAGLLRPQIQADGVSTTRTEPGSTVLLEAFQAFPGQTSILDWGKIPYQPGENGGISGIVFYGSTRGENDPRLTVGDPWEPGIPGVKVRLYRVVEKELGGTGLALVEELETDSWDASLPTECPGEDPGDPFTVETLGVENLTRCYDGWRNWNQIRPGVFDGGYAFNDIPPGKYVVEVVPPPGYELIKEEDKNVDFGDAYVTAPVPMMLPGGAMLLVMPDQAMILASLAAEPGLAQPPCVGAPHEVPMQLSLFPGVDTYAPFAGSMRPLCDRKEVILSDQGQAAADFHLFTSTPIAAQFAGLITDDIATETDPTAPGYGEQWSPAYLPVSIRDFNGHEVYRGNSDAYGRYNGVLPSTYTANIPIPSGYSPAMMAACLNDPGPLAGGGLDPLVDTGYGIYCYTMQFMPGTTTYLDTPILPTSAFAAGFNSPDCAFEEGTPTVSVVNGSGAGPWIDSTGIAPLRLQIHSEGVTQVPNPAYAGPSAPAPFNEPTVPRDLGFGGTSGTVTVDGVELSVVSWTDTLIEADLPNADPRTGELVVVRGDNGNRSFNTVTVTVSADAPIRVPADHPTIQAAIDAAAPGSLILVEPGTYEELVIMWKPVRLQGSGASTLINAVKRPVQKLQTWIQTVEEHVALEEVDLLPGQPAAGELVGPDLLATELGAGITVLAKNDGSFQGNASRIDGFTITGADGGGGIFVNGYAHNLEISNNEVTGNSGTLHGGIRVGHPSLPLVGDGPFGFNTHVHIHDNAITLNGSLGEQSTGAGVSMCTGADDYEIVGNFVCGNYTQGDGAGIGHLGLSDDGLIQSNRILFNQSVNQGLIQHGGGISIAGEPPEPPALTRGTGDVVVDANLIQGNHAGSGHGGGMRTQLVNGVDATTTPWSLTITNNMIVNNVSSWSGAGLSLQDTIDASVVNNTIAHNDSTATLGSLIIGGSSEPQPAGISSERHSLALASALSQPDGFSNPTLSNNIVWENRSFHYDDSQVPLLQPALAPVAVGECAGGATYWDLGVLGEPAATPALQLAPTYSVLSDTTGYDGSNVSGTPDFVAGYCNGNRTFSEPWGPSFATPIFGEGGNFVDVRFGPLTRAWPAGSPSWSYRIGPLSAGLDNGNNADAPRHDIDQIFRPLGAAVDRGAHEHYVPEPSGPLGMLAGIALLRSLPRRRGTRGRQNAGHR